MGSWEADIKQSPADLTWLQSSDLVSKNSNSQSTELLQTKNSVSQNSKVLGMKNRPPENIIPLGADKWLNAMPTGDGWTPPVVQPVKEVEFKQCENGEQVVEWLYAEIRQSDLGKGTNTNTTVREWVKKVGRRNDDAGHIIGKNQGGLGTEKWNIFPQTANINRGVFASNVETIFNNAAETNTVKIWFRFEFENKAEPCRASKFHYFVDFGNGSTMNNDLTNA